MLANGAGTPTAIITHAGVDNVVINQDNVNALMDGAQQIESAAAGVNDTNAIDAIMTLLGLMAMVVRILVRLIVNFSGHIAGFESMVDNKIMALQGQAQATFDAAKLGYENLTKKMDTQSIEMARVITDARDSFESIKQEMETIKSISEAELIVIKDALRKVENDIRATTVNTGIMGNQTQSGSNWLNNKWTKSAMEHKAITNLKELRSDKAGFRQWHDKFVNALAQVNREYRVVIQEIVKAIEKEEKLLVGGLTQWDNWINSRQAIGADVSQLNEDIFAVLMDKTTGEAYLRVKSVESGERIDAFVKIYKWFMGTSGMGLQDKARQIMAPIPPKSEGDIADSVEKYLEGLRIISGHKGYEMSYRLRVTALKMLIVGRARDHCKLLGEAYKEDN
jgi:hypothetical protein